MSLIFSDPSSRIKFIDKKLSQLYPAFKPWQYYFRQLLVKHLDKSKIVLDAGCGEYGILSEFKKDTKNIIGIDLDKKALEKNVFIDQKIVGNLDKIPLKNNSVDVVVSTFVLEHIENSQIVFNQIYRVLKPGGVFIFITPNLFNPVIFFSKLCPFWLHRFLRRKLLHKIEEGTHKTYYRANTNFKLTNLAKVSKFSSMEILTVGNPEYLAFSRYTAVSAVLIEKMIDNKLLELMKMYIIGYFKK